MKVSSVILSTLLHTFNSVSAFAPNFNLAARFEHSTNLRMSTSLQEPSSMRVNELRKELESYGISTKSYFEKSELVTAVEKARIEGKIPISSDRKNSSTSEKTEDQSSSSSKPSKSISEQMTEEIEKCKDMKVSDLKAELKSYGISTSTFFEKSEFVQALAKARVEGPPKSNSKSEGYAEYKNVEVITDDSQGPKKRSQQQSGENKGRSPFDSAGGNNPFSGTGGNPFSGGVGGANPFAGMGGNPFAGAGTNPFGGMGGNPFSGAGIGGGMGDQMKKVQEMMSNPNIQRIMAKAQKNPRIMKAVSECMGNPMAFAKYQNDPEVGELIRELQKYM